MLEARNLGIKRSKGKIIAFIDSDCAAPEYWLSKLVEGLEGNKSIGGIGGTNISPNDDLTLGKAIDFVFSSYIGSLGSASLYNPSKPKFVSALACINSAFWRYILEKVDGFDEEYELCEDTNLSYKVRNSGYDLLFDPNISVYHYRRDSAKRFSNQFFLYGLGRMRSMLTNKSYANKGSLFPFIAILSFPVLIYFSPFMAISFVTVYLLSIVSVGFYIAYKTRSRILAVLVPSVFIVEHFSYFFGMLYGVTLGKWKKKSAECSIYLRKIIRGVN